MYIAIVAFVGIICFLFGRFWESTKSKESGYYIIDDRDPEKTSITLDIHQELEDLAKKRFVTFRVLKKI